MVDKKKVRKVLKTRKKAVSEDVQISSISSEKSELCIEALLRKETTDLHQEAFLADPQKDGMKGGLPHPNRNDMSKKQDHSVLNEEEELFNKIIKCNLGYYVRRIWKHF